MLPRLFILAYVEPSIRTLIYMLIAFLVIGLICYLIVNYILPLFGLPAKANQIIGIIIGLLGLLYALSYFGIF